MLKEEGKTDGPDVESLDGLAAELSHRLDSLELRVLLSREEDKLPCFLQIHAGAGGTESQDWAQMLLRMYMRWAERKGFKLEQVDLTDGEQIERVAAEWSDGHPSTTVARLRPATVVGYDGAWLAGALDAVSGLPPGDETPAQYLHIDDLASAVVVAFVERLDALDLRIKQRVAGIAGKPYFVFHEAFDYFEANYGLKHTGVFSVAAEVQPGAQHVAAMRARLQEVGKTCVFSEPPLRPRLAETLVAGLPVKLAELDALGGYTPATAQGYEQVLEKLGNDLAGCLESL